MNFWLLLPFRLPNDANGKGGWEGEVYRTHVDQSVLNYAKLRKRSRRISACLSASAKASLAP